MNPILNNEGPQEMNKGEKGIIDPDISMINEKEKVPSKEKKKKKEAIREEKNNIFLISEVYNKFMKSKYIPVYKF